ncbi:MAG: gluconate 2-dehydrogenase subunit 3 family protein [Steroidobacteraceae bacterium]
MNEPSQPDRRLTLQWVLAASATLPLLKFGAAAADTPAPTAASAAMDKARANTAAGKGYGTDPQLTPVYHSGELWPLTLTAAERSTTAALCDLIIPADTFSPSAAAVGVVDFIDEWISAPYSEQQLDRTLIRAGLARLEDAATQRFGRAFPVLSPAEQTALCEPISYLPMAAPARREDARFFARFRDVAAGGFYTTPQGTRDLGYVGNVPLTRFDGPPPEVLKRVGLL